MQRIALTTALFLVSLSLLLSAPLQNRSVLISNEEPLTLINSKINPFTLQSEGNSSGQIREFELLGKNIAWLLAGNQLLKTEDNGTTWNGITPDELSSQGIAAIDFIDPDHGWLVAIKSGTEGIPQYSLLSTEDGGISWESWPLDLFDPSDPGAVSNSVTLSMQDSQVGWLMVKQATSSNFSSGELFKTVDGGHSWQKLTIPLGEEVFFIDSNHGWTAGGPASDELYVTRDGGMSWRSALYEMAAASPGDLTQLPVSNQSGRILLPLIRNLDGKSQVLFQTTNDKGNHWEISATQNLEDSIDSGIEIPLSSIGEESFIFHLPGSDQLFQIDPEIGTIRLLAEEEQLRGITTIQMISPTTGWVLRHLGSCQDGICRQQSQILSTEDGGQSWHPISLPPSINNQDITSLEFRPSSQKTEIADLSLTLTLQGQAFDKCEIPTLDKLQDWFTHSPYKTVNLYIGGGSRACANSALTGPYIHSMSEQGWRFIPTWVGPQAYCTQYNNKIPKDKDSAYQAGIDEAKKAIDKAASLGLTESDKSGSVIYYDLEGFNEDDTACLTSAKHFVSGWSYQMRLQGNVPGLYGLARNLDPIHSANNPPDVIWLAHWVYSSYNSNANTSSPYLNDTYWTNHQRIRQYAGDHTESWGITTIGGIDSNVMDGMVSDITGTYPLSVVKSGNGKGTVVSSPAGINCGTNCYINFPPNSTIKLTATPESGSFFASWSSNCVVTPEKECQVTIDKYKEVTATFTLNSYELSVGLNGNGSGKVTSNPGGIDCGSDCKENYPYGSKVTLTAVPASNSTLSSWSGPCTITGELTCEVTIDLAKQVTATYKLAHLLTINKNGNGKGTVTSNPSGINCGSDCNQNFEVDLSVILTAVNSPGSIFTGWTGTCTSTTATTCTVKMDQARQITATFTTNNLFMPWTGKD